jgi:hypothetical protein
VVDLPLLVMLLSVLKPDQAAMIKGLLIAKMSSHGNEALLVRQLLGNNAVAVTIGAANITLETLRHPVALHLGLGIADVDLTAVELILILVVKMVDMCPLLHPVEPLLGSNLLQLLAVTAPMVAMQFQVMKAILHQAWEPLLD